MSDASCRGCDAGEFFPSDGVGVERARSVCSQCSVRVRCLEFALTNRLDHGVWGGTSERERQRLLRVRELEPAGAATQRPGA